MFEDSTFESSGRICTRSREWMAATFAFNSSILLALILIPLWLTQALPRFATPFWMETPQAPQPAPRTVVHQPGTVVVQPTWEGVVIAPSVIPHGIPNPGPPEVLGPSTLSQWAQDNQATGPDPFAGTNSKPIVRPKPEAVRVSSLVVAGLLIHKAVPVYPPIAKATHTQGTVVLEATISKRGTIENLHVVSGPPLLVQAALDAVSTWLYRPYLLNGEPVDVETTVNVNFSLE